MTRFLWFALWALVGCGGGPSPVLPEEVTEAWTAGDDEPLE